MGGPKTFDNIGDPCRVWLWNSFHWRYFFLTIQIRRKIYFILIPNFNKVMATKYCKWHTSSAIVHSHVHEQIYAKTKCPSNFNYGGKIFIEMRPRTTRTSSLTQTIFYRKLLQSQGVNTLGESHLFDNPGYVVGSQRPSTSSTNALIPGGSGTGTQAVVATGSQGTQAGYLVMAPPPYISDNRAQGNATRNAAEFDGISSYIYDHTLL